MSESVLIGSMNWGSSAALRNREMGVLIHGQELASEYLQSFDEDWSRLDTNTDSDGDLLPDMWEIQYGLNRHSAAILGTALSEQSLDLDEDGLNNLNEYLWGGDPNDNDTDDDCILDGEEAEFAQSLGRSPVVAMNSNDVDDNGYLMAYNLGAMKKKSSTTTMVKETIPMSMMNKTMMEKMEGG